VGGFGKMRLLVGFAVAAETTGAGLLPRFPFEHKYFGFVTAARYVVGSGTVTSLTPLLRGTALGVERGLPVRRLFPRVINLLVTRLAGLGSNVVRNFGGGRTSHRCCGGWNTLTCGRRIRLAGSKSDDHEKK